MTDDNDDDGETWWSTKETLGCKWLTTPFHHPYNLHLYRTVACDSSATEGVASGTRFQFTLRHQFSCMHLLVPCLNFSEPNLP